MSSEHWRNNEWQQKMKYPEQNLPTVSFPHRKFHMSWD
jgi:hypothetical protein